MPTTGRLSGMPGAPYDGTPKAAIDPLGVASQKLSGAGSPGVRPATAPAPFTCPATGTVAGSPASGSVAPAGVGKATTVARAPHAISPAAPADRRTLHGCPIPRPSVPLGVDRQRHE